MGSLVKFDGLVQFLDLKIMRNLWEPILRAYLRSQGTPENVPSAGNRKHRREKHPTQSPIPDVMKFGLEIMKEVPHLLHMTFLGPEGLRFWAAAQPDYLTISSDSLVMKFGAVVDGVWTIVGIVDGRIGKPPEPVTISPALDGIVTAMAAFREFAGRPRDHWGLTPIAIYAPLRGAAETEVVPDPVPTPSHAPRA
jgi:hypothetical protein